MKTDLRRAKVFAGHESVHTKESQSDVNVNTIACTSPQRLLCLFSMARQPEWAGASSLSRLLDRTSYESSEREIGKSHRYSWQHQHSQHIFMTSGRFELTILANEWSQIHALDRVGTGIGPCCVYIWKKAFRCYRVVTTTTTTTTNTTTSTTIIIITSVLI